HAGLLRLRPHVPRRAAARGRLRLGRGHVPGAADAGDRPGAAPGDPRRGQPVNGRLGQGAAATATAAGLAQARRGDERWAARRRWSRAAIAYLVMLILSIFFVGPLLFAALSSVKTDPLEYPPELLAPQLSPANWAAAGRLGRQGANAPLWGGFAPGAEVEMNLTYFVPEGVDAAAPSVVVPRRRPGGGLGAVQRKIGRAHV